MKYEIESEGIKTNYVWCERHGIKHGFWLARVRCLDIQSDPEIHCPMKCKEKVKK